MDIILYNIIACLASLIFGYFFGSIPTGIILCKIFYNADPRDSGSKNSGGTNVGRLFGKKIGFVTILLDAIKTFLPMFLVWMLLEKCGIRNSLIEKHGIQLMDNGLLAIIFAPLGATIGHCWPVYAQFKGGKAVASYAGFAISTCWLNFIICFLIFGGVLKFSKHVSLSSIIGSISWAVLSWILFLITIFAPDLNVNFAFVGLGKTTLWAAANLEYAVVSTIISLILILRHIPNIKRLINHSESTIKWMK